MKNQTLPTLHLSNIQLTAEYRKKWGVNLNDFVLLTRDDEPINSSLYRVGGFDVNLKDDYFILLKQVESYYDDEITEDAHQKPYLAQCACLIDKNGIERKIFGEFDFPFIIKDSLIYSIEGKYFNIETGEFYCETDNSMNSGEFLFLENKWDVDKNKRGF